MRNIGSLHFNLETTEISSAKQVIFCWFIYILIILSIWDSIQLNHPYGTFSKFPEQAKEK